jgi:nitroimidazol reductase NimA-like FMN-containing flavoprotein (pyridoxamine 5'-phosphate oxidase superfamily)
MNPHEIAAYLDAPHIAVVATISRNGASHLTPNEYRYDGKVLTLITRTDRLKYCNLQRDRRLSVCIYDPSVASNDVVISGTATCDDQDIWDEAHRIIERYRALDEVDDYLALAHGAAGAHHGHPGAHLDASVRETVSCREANGAG